VSDKEEQADPGETEVSWQMERLAERREVETDEGD
jgi:hypothetical protein